MTLSLSMPTRPVLDIRSALTRVGRGINRTIRAMQCARMHEAMNRLSDDQLGQIGLTRSDISRHAYACVHDASK